MKGTIAFSGTKAKKDELHNEYESLAEKHNE